MARNPVDRVRFKVVQDGATWAVLDRAYCCKPVGTFGLGGVPGAPEKLARAKASALNLKHGPWPIKARRR